MAVFTDRIVLKTSSLSDSIIRTAIQTGGAEEINFGELVIGNRSGYVDIFTKDANGDIVTLTGGSNLNVVIVSVDAPTVREDGSALQDGDFWYNSANQELSIRFNSQWYLISGGGGGGGGTLGDLTDVNTSGPATNVYTFPGGFSGSVTGTCEELATRITEPFGVAVAIGGSPIDSQGQTVNFAPLLGGLGNSGILYYATSLTGPWYQWNYTVTTTNLYACFGLTEVAPIPADWATVEGSSPAYVTFDDPDTFPPFDGAYIAYDANANEWQLARANSASLVSESSPTVNVNGGALAEGNIWFRPSDAVFHVYSSGAWTPIATGLADAPSDGSQYVRKDGAWEAIVDAPADNKEYIRKNNSWQELIIPAGGGGVTGRGDGGDVDTTSVDSSFIFAVWGGGDVDTTAEDLPVELITKDVDGGEIT